MSTDLAPTVVESPVADATGELKLIARSPAEMHAAQRSLASWCASKISIMQADADELREQVEIAERNGWKTAVLSKHHLLASKRVEFYRKVRAAVEAGYCIVPNFPVDIFAIRTEREYPLRKESTSEYATHSQSSESPPIGTGEMKSPEPVVYEKTVEVTDGKGGFIKGKRYWAQHFEGEIEFPISVARAEIMSATGEAMALKCFDELGVLPGKKAKTDPIVVGIIKDPRSAKYSPRFVTFLIAWYVDTAAL